MPLNNRRPSRRTGLLRTRRARGGGPRFVVQHHAARENYYDFRLEIDGVLVSWAIPRGPAVNPRERRMARRTEDCPLDDGATADGDGGDAVIVWDRGTYANKTAHEMATCLGVGHLSFLLDGEKLHGDYALTRVRDGDQETWLLVKRPGAVVDAAKRIEG